MGRHGQRQVTFTGEEHGHKPRQCVKHKSFMSSDTLAPVMAASNKRLRDDSEDIDQNRGIRNHGLSHGATGQDHERTKRPRSDERRCRQDSLDDLHHACRTDDATAWCDRDCSDSSVCPRLEPPRPAALLLRGQPAEMTRIDLITYEVNELSTSLFARTVAWFRRTTITPAYCHWQLRLRYVCGSLEYVDFIKDHIGHLRATTSWATPKFADEYQEGAVSQKLIGYYPVTKEDLPLALAEMSSFGL
ncbi:hypothetical protein MTO96_007237 [Rhipicephalus appendiculatus]